MISGEDTPHLCPHKTGIDRGNLHLTHHQRRPAPLFGAGEDLEANTARPPGEAGPVLGAV